MAARAKLRGKKRISLSVTVVHLRAQQWYIMTPSLLWVTAVCVLKPRTAADLRLISRIVMWLWRHSRSTVVVSATFKTQREQPDQKLRKSNTSDLSSRAPLIWTGFCLCSLLCLVCMTAVLWSRLTVKQWPPFGHCLFLREGKDDMLKLDYDFDKVWYVRVDQTDL